MHIELRHAAAGTALAFLTIGLSSCALQQPPTTTALTSSSEIQLSLQRIVQDAGQAGFSGAALVTRNGEDLLDQAVGAIHGVAMRPDSRFWFASSGKQFTAAAVLLCAERGLLSLDAPLASVLPEAPAEKREITIRQLLSYTSGLPASDAGEIVGGADEAIRDVLALPMEAAPGERFIYSNANYVLAAALVERRAGVPFSVFLRREILDRAHLNDTGQAVGGGDHRIAPIGGELPLRLRDPRWSALSYYSTTGDFRRWVDDLERGRVLSRASVDAMFAPVAPIQEGQAALGWFVDYSPRGARRVFTRGYEDMGANSSIYYYPDSRTLIVVLTHAGDADAGGELSWSRALHRNLEVALGL